VQKRLRGSQRGSIVCSMHPRQIETALKTVITRLKSKEAARSQATMENVLLDFADEQNMAPAQLEKLAQSLNLTLALSHAKHAADRGSSFDIVSTPKLLSRFMDPARKPANKSEGAANQTSDQKSHRGFQAPSALAAKPTTKVANEVEVPADWQGFTVRGHFKEATPRTPQWVDIDRAMDTPHVGGWHKVATTLRAPEANAEILTTMAGEAWSRMVTGLNKLAGVIRATPHSYPEVVQDILAYTKSAAVLEVLDRHLDKLALPRTRVEPDTRAFVRDRHKVASTAQDILAALEERQACLAVRDEFLAAKEAATATATETRSETRRSEKKNLPQREPDYDGYFQDRPVAEGSSADTLRKLLLDGAGAGRDVLNLGASTAQGTAAQFAGALPIATEQAQRSADGYAALFGDKHRSQYNNLANKMEAWQHAAVLQRLLMSDEVLSKMNPADVAGAFQTLRTSSPRVARDINVTRSLLREALQHQGVPLQQVKTLRDVEGKTQPTEDNTSRRL
jgi:hypothetical protein